MLQKWRWRHAEAHQWKRHFVIQFNTHTLMENESEIQGTKEQLYTLFYSEAYGDYWM
jgi:hypothetical protein